VVGLRGPTAEMRVQVWNIAISLRGYAIADIGNPAGSLT